MIKNFEKEQLKGSSYDLRLGEVFKHGKIAVVDVTVGKLPELKTITLPYVMQPNEFVIARTIEDLETPYDLMGILAPKAESFRTGLGIFVGLVDPGYKGPIVFGIKNLGENKITLTKGMPLVKITYSTIKGDTIPVQTKYMGGKIL